MDPDHQRLTVLYVDQALSFGGSVVVLGNLVGALDTGQFRPVVVGEMDRAVLDYYIGSRAPIYIVRRPYHYLHWSRTERLVSRLPAGIVRKLATYGFSFLRGLLNSAYGVRIGWIMFREKADIVHVNNGLSNLAPVLFAVLLRRPFVVHFHGPEVPGFVHRLLIGKVPRFIAVSEHLRGRLVDNGLPADRMLVMHNPVRVRPAAPESQAALRARYGLEEDDLVFGIVGRITGWKGQLEFVRAALAVLESVPRSRAVIVGDCSDTDPGYQAEIAALIGQSGAGDRIIMAGFTRDVAAWYGIMELCVHASVWPEPFGLVITEAMACGVPVVASDRGAAREIIRDGEDGFIVDPEDTGKLASTITRLLTDEPLRHRMGNRAQQRILRDYRPGHYARGMEQLYRELLD